MSVGMRGLNFKVADLLFVSNSTDKTKYWHSCIVESFRITLFGGLFSFCLLLILLILQEITGLITEGNVFTGVCLFTEGGWLPSMHHWSHDGVLPLERGVCPYGGLHQGGSVYRGCAFRGVFLWGDG